MQNTLEKKSTILLSKSRFFLFRIVIYLLFMLIPMYIEKFEIISQTNLLGLSLFYITFSVMQWFLIGKEFDYRFKIFIRFNSSIERVVYRIYLGMILCMLIFNVLYILPLSMMKNFFWGFWIIFGLFHSWPTRGKIITESVSTHLYEYKFLDKFEKTIVVMTFLFFIFSIPAYSNFQNPFTLRLNYDPSELISSMYWNFLYVNYLPFNKHPELLGRLWNFHLYTINVGLFLAVYYVFLRYYFSRRLALLGVLVIISSWPFFKMMEFNLGILLHSGSYLLLIWSLILVYKSSTYRAGAFLGLMNLYVVISNREFLPIVVIGNLYLYYVFLNKKNIWYKKKLLKYCLTGMFLLVTVILTEHSNYSISSSNLLGPFSIFFKYLNTKAFYKISILGIFFMFFYFFKNKKFVNTLFFEKDITYLFILFFLLTFLFQSFNMIPLLNPFSYMWILPFFCLVPLEYLFNKMKAFRSNINLIYMFYILTVLLDSHFEVRVKLFFRNFILQ